MATIHTSDNVGSSDRISSIPSPPSLDGLAIKKRWQRLSDCCYVPKDKILLWNKIFMKCSSAHHDIINLITTVDDEVLPAHKFVLSMASPVFHELIRKNVLSINISLVPHEALRIFVRFLYTSWFNLEDLKKFVLHVLHLSHFYDVPCLEQCCIKYLENRGLTTTNVMNVLRLSKDCDLRRLSFICFRRILRDFKTIILTNGWKDMSVDNPALVDKLLQMINSKNQEMLRKPKMKNAYVLLHVANRALVHIYKDGCIRIGPQGILVEGRRYICNFFPCKEVNVLLHHFCSCETRVPGGCNPCICLWKLLELHSRMCDAPRSCNAPLCSAFRKKFTQQIRKEEVKWKLLAIKVKQVKI